MSPVCLVVAKAPVPGQVKTRLAASVGDVAAAELAAAALADTLETCAAAFDRCWLAVTGDLEAAVGAATLTALLRDWTVVPQRGSGLGQRLANAHRDVGTDSRAPVLQLGMDTPRQDRISSAALPSSSPPTAPSSALRRPSPQQRRTPGSRRPGARTRAR